MRLAVERTERNEATLHVGAKLTNWVGKPNTTTQIALADDGTLAETTLRRINGILELLWSGNRVVVRTSPVCEPADVIIECVTALAELFGVTEAAFSRGSTICPQFESYGPAIMQRHVRAIWP